MSGPHHDPETQDVQAATLEIENPAGDQGGETWASVPFETVMSRPCDCAVVATDHTAFDYSRIAELPLVVDTRNALKGLSRPSIFTL